MPEPYPCRMDWASLNQVFICDIESRISVSEIFLLRRPQRVLKLVVRQGQQDAGPCILPLAAEKQYMLQNCR